MNVAAKVSISETQDIYVMSNWYGMNNFPDVFDFSRSKDRTYSKYSDSLCR